MSKILEAAIEAAAKACWDDYNSDPWPDGDECDKDVFIRDARVALEAALPHLIRAAVADALEAAAEAKYDGLYRESLYVWLYDRAAAVRAGEA